MASIEAVSLPDHLADGQLRGRVAVVIDVLRATTTIAAALEHGARCVVPVASVGVAREMAGQREGSVLCGERGGVRPEGFTLGNSPLEYTRDAVEGRVCVLSTTNGTRAIHKAAGADEVLIGSITNAAALCAYLRSLGSDVVLVCSGTDGRVSLEDCLGAGLIVDRLGYSGDDSAVLMRDAYLGGNARYGGLVGAIGSSYHARRLVDLGFIDDVRYCAGIDACGVVPRFGAESGEITLV